MKKILLICVWVIFAIGLIFVMSFADRAHAKRICGKLNISIDRKDGQQFITNDDVIKFLTDHNQMPEGKELDQVSVPAIENLLLTNPAIETCEVFMSVGGEMTVNIKQRRNIARLINLQNESYYFDDQGKLMPWSEEYTSPVLVVNGLFADSYGANYDHSFDNIDADSAMKTTTLLDDIWQIAKRIDADTFLRAQMTQLYLSPDKGFELIPRIGNHIIVLGDISDLDEKFQKLFIFYRDGLERTGTWNDYTFIDLQYKNQIVCTKKNINYGI